MNELMKFEDTEIEIIEINGEPHFEVYSTGMALGQIVTAKGRNYPNKDRIERNLENASIAPVLHNAKLYISEPQLYDLMLEMKTDKCRPFRKWVTGTVLPTIRREGTYSIPWTTQKHSYPLNASVADGVANLLRVFRATMKDEGQPPEIIAQVVKSVSAQFGVVLPDNFVKTNPFQQFALVGMFWPEQGQSLE